jgi:hypothetical protein
MVPVISANALLVWFVWGFFMALGWALGTWVMARLIAAGHVGTRSNLCPLNES